MGGYRYLGRVVVEAETANAAREKVERKGYIVLDVNRDNSSQAVSFYDLRVARCQKAERPVSPT